MATSGIWHLLQILFLPKFLHSHNLGIIPFNNGLLKTFGKKHSFYDDGVSLSIVLQMQLSILFAMVIISWVNP